MMYLSKSKYCELWQCPKMAWLRKYKPEAAASDDGAQARMDDGNTVGDLAMGLFGDFAEVTEFKDGRLDIDAMIKKTKAHMDKGTPVICEASFAFEGLYCAVDILRRERGGRAIYEVKSSTHYDKAVYYADVAYQTYVLRRCGVNVTGAYLVYINSDYVFNGELELSKLFRIVDISENIAGEYANVEANINAARTLMESDEEPYFDLSAGCKKPYPCDFWGYCARNLPVPSVFDLYRLPLEKKLEYYREGLVSFEALERSGKKMSAAAKRQMDFSLRDRGTFVDKKQIKAFLERLSYPLYFLDFETVQPAVPRYPGTRPYTQIPFQYSLHYIESEDGDIRHCEFLADPGVDPRRDIAESLCRDIPMNVCVTAYNKSFECLRLKELAEMFPDLREHLMNIADNVVDLLTPFQSGWYYNRAMGGSFSIKSVLPAVCPGDPKLDYHNLDGVHNGGEAMNAFAHMEKMTPEERETTRRNLLKYCELDTYAMVKVWEKLRDAVM